MARITVINNSDIVELHGEHCQDIAKKAKKPFVEVVYTAEYATVREAFLDYNADFIEGDDESGAWPVTNFPCTGIK